MFPLRVCSLLFFMASQSFLLWFFLILSFYSSSCGNPPVLYCAITFGHEFYDRKALEDNSNQNSNSTVFRIYVVVLAIYAGVQFFVSFLLRFPACHRLTNRCDSWPVVRFIKWMHQVSHFYQIFFEGWSFLTALWLRCSSNNFAILFCPKEHYYVGRGMYEGTFDFIK